jgi:hypothetical protein
MQRKPVDIEKLLQWSFLEELPKGQPVDASPLDALRHTKRFRLRQDGARRDYDVGFVQGAPHPDAKVIGRAVEALPSFACTPADIENLLGPLIALDSRVSPALVRVAFSPIVPIARHAVMSTRPRWNVGMPRPQRTRRSGGGRHVVIWQDSNGEWQEGLPPGAGWRYPANALAQCPLTWADPTVIEVAEARIDYVIWHRGLMMLVKTLADQLAEHEALAPSAAAAPWIEDTEARSRVLVNNHTAHMTQAKPLPLAPQRDAPRLPPLKTRPGTRASPVRDILDGAA